MIRSTQAAPDRHRRSHANTTRTIRTIRYRCGLRIELRQDGSGTLLTLTDTFDDLGKAARDAAGWHECLDRLAGDLAGVAPPPWGERWRQIHPVYVAELGPEASAIGPPA